MNTTISQEKNFHNNGFEFLIKELLIQLGYLNIRQNISIVINNISYEIDILLGEENNHQNPLTIVEIKSYRPQSSPSLNVIEMAWKHLRRCMEATEIHHGILIFPTIPNNTKILLNFSKNIQIWDINIILEKAKPFPTIYNKIIDFLELPASNKIPFERSTLPQSTKLIKELEGISTGRDDAFNFENWCIKSLKYLFEDYLAKWEEQSSTVDELHRRDLVCRVKDSQTEVWQFISHTINSRYVVFEFKNYTKKITQKEIITTERYLYPKALRNCAFIISREGASLSAQQVIEGAMREHGKLIISLSIEDMIQLLINKDQGNDPNVFLFNKIDDFLIGLGR